MGSLWTPFGEYTPRSRDESRPDLGPSADAEGRPADAEGRPADEALRRLREELARTPVRDVVANHAVALWQLALLHLGLDRSAQPEAPDAPTSRPNLPEAKLAIDSMAALVEGLGDRLGDHARPLRDALAQVRLAYVQAAERS